MINRQLTSVIWRLIIQNYSLLNFLIVHTNNKTSLVSLFVEGQPIVFEVNKEQQVFHFEPLSSWKDLTAPESFSLECQDKTWSTHTDIDTDLFYQAVEEVEKMF
ncbi:hypothetical protein SY85_23180 [Flavisolibacter tropicus]|uniref:Uncharacterized protein n=1 Tax=Flavisolibacter tropicus TaxID=1492898 RepID=A0A172U113_9BACT|nr:hypothetical protein SY85_23180 [Flavisolibacter tropicus]